MARLDFFAPAFAVKLNGNRLESEVSRNILDLRITDSPGLIDTFAFTLANPYPELRWTHDREVAELFREGAVVQIELGYVDRLHLMIEGLIASSSPSFPSSGTPTVAIEGKSRLVLMTRERKQRTFTDLTDKEIVEAVARNDYNFVVEAGDTGAAHAHVYQDNKTDLEFLIERAKRLKFELTMRGNTLGFRRPRFEKLYTLVWGRPTREYDDQQRYMPVLDFTPTLNTKDQVSSVVVRGHDPLSRKLFEGRAGAGDEQRKIGSGKLGGKVAEDAMGKPAELVLVNQPVRSQQEATARAKAIYNDKALHFVTGSATTVGLPELRSGQLVEIEGVGYRFDGEYLVTETTHSFGGSGYQTSFKVQRNATNE
jgi:phage protein D